MKCDLLDLHSLFGKKWTYGLFYSITLKGSTYNELFTATDKKINETLLSSRLKELMGYNLIKKEIKDGHTCYSSTAFGEKLKKSLMNIKSLIEENGCCTPEQCKGKDCSNCPSFKKN